DRPCSRGRSLCRSYRTNQLRGMMAEEDKDPPLTEPLIVGDAFATGVDIESINGDVRLIAWVTHAEEHRIVARIVLPDSVARALIRDLRKALSHGSN
ncbi:hypothetical protein LB579_31525, partial [Mesorhizobium sp. BR1-1-7]|uniref:hypothetical protein n=1 Tax=Mesorhizobium sp. BR1-1-7 TaxID=2876647 RepID=UPI001CC9CAA5